MQVPLHVPHASGESSQFSSSGQTKLSPQVAPRPGAVQSHCSYHIHPYDHHHTLRESSQGSPSPHTGATPDFSVHCSSTAIHKAIIARLTEEAQDRAGYLHRSRPYRVRCSRRCKCRRQNPSSLQSAHTMPSPQTNPPGPLQSSAHYCGRHRLGRIGSHSEFEDLTIAAGCTEAGAVQSALQLPQRCVAIVQLRTSPSPQVEPYDGHVHEPHASV